MEFINKVLSKENMTQAFNQVTKNKGAAGLDNITVEEAQDYVNKHWKEIKVKILTKKFFHHQSREFIFQKITAMKDLLVYLQ